MEIFITTQDTDNKFADQKKESFKKLVKIPEALDGLERTLTSYKFILENIDDLAKIVSQPALLKQM